MDIPAAELKIWTEGNWEERRYQYNIKPNETVLDLGAYDGDFASKIHEIYQCNVIAVEPTGSILGFKNFPWCHVINEAAWVNNERRNFGGAFYYTSAHENGSTSYPCFDINGLLKFDIALMKINIEGDEYSLLWHILYNDTQGFIDNFQIQFHQIPGYEKDYEAITKLLSKTHKLDWRVSWVWESWSKKKRGDND